LGSLKGLVARRRHADDDHPLALQQVAGGAEEVRVVVDDEGAESHGVTFRIAAASGRRIAGSRDSICPRHCVSAGVR
jgi:hypothetical protein